MFILTVSDDILLHNTYIYTTICGPVLVMYTPTYPILFKWFFFYSGKIYNSVTVKRVFMNLVNNQYITVFIC